MDTITLESLNQTITGKVIGITGSRGKSIVKDALVLALMQKYHPAGSRMSYDKQLGLPLLLQHIPKGTDFAVIGAEVSACGEMERLAAKIQPDYGILTNIGTAHLASFGSRQTIAEEMIKLFNDIPADGWVLVPHDCEILEPLLGDLKCRILRFGAQNDELPFVDYSQPTNDSTVLSVKFPNKKVISITINTPRMEIASEIEIAICAAYLLGLSDVEIADALSGFQPAHTHMEIWRSPIGVTLIDDSYSCDPISIESALHTLARVKPEGGRGIFVFCGLADGFGDSEYERIGEMAAKNGVDLLLLSGGERLCATKNVFLAAAHDAKALQYDSNNSLIEVLRSQLEPGDTVLLNGPQGGGIEKTARELTTSMAYNRYIVDLAALSENISRFRKLVGENTKVLTMVKAIAYGSDLIRLSREIQNLGMDVLGVSTADEGMLLRKAGIELPILVTLCTAGEVDKIARYNLIPAVYSFDLIAPLAEAARKSGKTIPVHLKTDTGMGRLGVMPEDVAELGRQVTATGCLKVAGLMTHFGVADDPTKDDVTRLQIERFKGARSDLHAMGLTDITCHAAATSGTARFPESHFDMVRIGLGLYGLYPSPAIEEEIELELAIGMVSRLVEIRTHKAGNKIGYNGTFTVPHDDFKVGIIPMGYHDGLPVHISNKGCTKVNGYIAPIIGRVSMDSAAIDLSDVQDAHIGSDVLIYGQYDGHTIRPEEAAKRIGTHSYELIARLGSRVQRIFVK